MTNAVYARLAKSASRLIRAYGQPIILTRTTLGTYDVATGVPTAAVTTAVTMSAVVTDWKTDESDARQSQESIRGSNAGIIQFSDKKVVLESTYAPALEDKVTIGGVVHSLVPPIRTVGPAGVAVVYILRAQAG